MHVHRPPDLGRVIATAMATRSADEAARRWAASGAMALTGPRDGDPLVGPARVAPAMDALAAVVADASGRVGARVEVDGAALLGERAACTGFGRNGAISPGGACRLLRAADDWIALSLARPSDVDLMDALLDHPVHLGSSTGVSEEDWERIGREVASIAAVDLAARSCLLGMPLARLGEVDSSTALVQGRLDEVERPPLRLDEALVADLSSLWAGPLCADLLGRAGAAVVKIESTTRPDGARFGNEDFFTLLHGGHDSVALDFTTAAGRHDLRALLARADIVIEASRPRALIDLGVSFTDMRATGWSGLWVSITAYGREGAAAMRVGFGDDAAAAGGLTTDTDEGPAFCADAVADPATGLVAAAAVTTAAATGRHGMIDVALARTAAHLSAAVRRHGPVAATPGIVAAAPRARPPVGPAMAFGGATSSRTGGA